MTYSVVVGAGATGRALVRQLLQSGERVKLVTRRDADPGVAGVERIPLDASDADALTRVLRGARTLFNCAMPRYDRWPQEFPALAAGMLRAAERAGVDYVMLGNVYSYGPSPGPVHERTPLAPVNIKGRIRADIWRQAKEATVVGRVRATEIRASDFLGSGAYSIYNLMVTPNVLQGRAAHYPGDLDVPHSWTFVEDAARTLIAASRCEQSWGRAWHVPSHVGVSVRELTHRLAGLAGAPTPQLVRMTREDVIAAGKNDSIVAEVEEILYLLERPFTLDAEETQLALGIGPTALEEVLRDTLRP